MQYKIELIKDHSPLIQILKKKKKNYHYTNFCPLTMHFLNMNNYKLFNNIVLPYGWMGLEMVREDDLIYMTKQRKYKDHKTIQTGPSDATL